MAMTGKNWIMIYGPKDMVLSSERPRAKRGDLDPEDRVRGDPAFPRAHALWAVCAGRSLIARF